MFLVIYFNYEECVKLSLLLLWMFRYYRKLHIPGMIFKAEYATVAKKQALLICSREFHSDDCSFKVQRSYLKKSPFCLEYCTGSSSGTKGSRKHSSPGCRSIDFRHTACSTTTLPFSLVSGTFQVSEVEVSVLGNLPITVCTKNV